MCQARGLIRVCMRVWGETRKRDGGSCGADLRRWIEGTGAPERRVHTEGGREGRETGTRQRRGKEGRSVSERSVCGVFLFSLAFDLRAARPTAETKAHLSRWRRHVSQHSSSAFSLPSPKPRSLAPLCSLLSLRPPFPAFPLPRPSMDAKSLKISHLLLQPGRLRGVAFGN